MAECDSSDALTICTLVPHTINYVKLDGAIIDVVVIACSQDFPPGPPSNPSSRRKVRRSPASPDASVRQLLRSAPNFTRGRGADLAPPPGMHDICWGNWP